MSSDAERIESLQAELANMQQALAVCSSSLGREAENGERSRIGWLAQRGRAERAEAELAEARAVIEQVGAEATRHSEVVDGCVRVETAYVTQVLSAYRAAPSSALDAEPSDVEVEAVLYHRWHTSSGYCACKQHFTTEQDFVRHVLQAARAAVLREGR